VTCSYAGGFCYRMPAWPIGTRSWVAKIPRLLRVPPSRPLSQRSPPARAGGTAGRWAKPVPGSPKRFLTTQSPASLNESTRGLHQISPANREPGGRRAIGRNRSPEARRRVADGRFVAVGISSFASCGVARLRWLRWGLRWSRFPKAPQAAASHPAPSLCRLRRRIKAPRREPGGRRAVGPSRSPEARGMAGAIYCGPIP
jgi:hypothetical protein